ncbi:von Willebrand factor [Tautonia plasticadhaerens]|uniref:von Willebrand factor n=2 Tax=Tautonia plasticadhaerens TaxID=2527974 RepID=A0A518GWM1_9BACT|nr:von Willebrand factor [Tautonia plasticadhaerens]
MPALGLMIGLLASGCAEQAGPPRAAQVTESEAESLAVVSADSSIEPTSEAAASSSPKAARAQFAFQQGVGEIMPGMAGGMGGMGMMGMAGDAQAGGMMGSGMMGMNGPVAPPEHNTESYARIDDNPFIRAAEEPLSTFSVDVDTASYANVRRFLASQRMLPPPDAVRIEELINYFVYDLQAPSEGDPHPFSVEVEVTRCPWDADHRLARIGVKGREVERDARATSNLVFLLDVSGSMDSPDKLPLLKRAMRLLVDELGENDRVAIVVYASSEGLALPSTPCDRKETILAALESLQAGGSTAGGAGIQLAYQVANENFIEGGINRVILCTDGDFNVGVSDEGQLTRMIEEKAKTGVFLSVLGFGTGNLQDSKMEALADRGNGNYAYIDSLAEAEKVLVEQMGGTLVTIAKDVKIQVDFNPAQVGAYRLIGYENRMLEARDFEDDAKDAGEIGAGHSVTALYELIPPAQLTEDLPAPSESRYISPPDPAAGHVASDELLTVNLRYKAPDGDDSTLVELPVVDAGLDYTDASPDFKFASAVAAFGMLLRGSPHVGDVSHDAVLELAQAGLEFDPGGYRAEFLELARTARDLSRENP